MVKIALQVFEYGCVAIGTDKLLPKGIAAIPSAAYHYLKQICLNETVNTQFLRLKNLGGVEVLQLQNYAGVILTPDGTQIEVLPKVTKHAHHQNGVAQSRAALLNMLRELGSFRHIQTNAASVKHQKMPLLEVFIGQFLSSVNHLIKKGLKSEYCQRRDNLFYLKGKLQVAEQLKRNSVSQHKFAVEYDEFLPDTLPNQLVKTALSKVLTLTRSGAHQKLARELLFAFEGVAFIERLTSDTENIHVSRGMDYYQAPIAWSNLILRGCSPLTMSGNSKAFSLLFPLESVFESYVASILAKLTSKDIKLISQAKSQHLVTYNTKGMFKLKPDLMLSSNHQALVVLDTKWKLIDQAKNNGTDKYQLSQADFYQMYAYGQKYLGGSGELILIYPASDQFNDPIPFSFEFSNELLLWVVPFDIQHDTPSNKRLMLPVGTSIEQLIETVD
jgi:5-methylcytosine-specific restriction enzyme subunit McrC